MKKVIFILIVISSFSLNAQTFLKHRVIINMDKYENKKNDKSFNIEDIQKIKAYNTIFYLKDTTIIKELVDNNKTVLTEKEIKNKEGKEFELKREIVNGKEIFKISKKIAASLKYNDKNYIKYRKANLYASNDTLYYNFWLRKINGKTYYESTDEGKRKFDIKPDEKYFIKLENRQYRSFYYSSYQISVLTLPFKYRFGYKENNVTVDPEFNTNVNLSTFFGKKFGKVTYSYDKYKGMQKSDINVTIGPVIGLSSQKIDSLSTSLDIEPLSKEFNVPALSYGFGTVFYIKEFNIGFFLGKDIGIGDKAKKWNFDNRLWFGFGFGYKLSFTKV